jgi:hypothetical protein
VARSLSTRLEADWRERHLGGMTEKDKERDERLAAALRENLRRRKGQARKIGGKEKKTES